MENKEYKGNYYLGQMAPTRIQGDINVHKKRKSSGALLADEKSLKPTFQFSMDGTFKKSYISSQAAANANKVTVNSINNNIKGVTKLCNKQKFSKERHPSWEKV